jgi:uncharacterized protein (TIGR02145 family)
MILLTQVNHWATKRAEKYVSTLGDHQIYTMAQGDYFFINTNRISDMITKHDGTTKFKFSQNPNDHRCSPDIIECNTTVANIEIAHNTVPPSKFIILPIFPTNDITRVLVDTPVNTLVEIDDIAIVYCTRRDVALNVAHCVYYRESFERVECIINYSFAEIYNALASLNPLLDMDGNIYTVVRIGDQEWTVGNLRTTTYADGTAIPNVTDTDLWEADVTGAYCWYDNDIGYKEPYGALYNWYAATSVRGLVAGQFTEGGVASVGWRVPTMADWDALIAEIGTDLTAGGLLKEQGLAHWNDPNEGATDTYGFRLMGNGNRWVDSQIPGEDNFDNMRIYSDTWSQDENAIDPTEGDSVYAGSDTTGLWDFNNEKYGGMAVRAVRDVVP